ILGPVAWYRFTLLIAGTPVIACMNMAFWLIMVVWLAGQPKVFADIFPGPIYYLSLVSLIFGNGAAIYMNLVSIREDGRSKLLWSALIVPAYWVLMSIAAIKGMWQMLFNPSYWEKTFHGLSSSSDDAADADDSVPAGAEGGSS
ncbi:N-acetylglucosaminyltransferase, partial [Streptomyces sp. SID10244]|nr:N-acetylglucosaminyltransferase [Streptomyces sp. SID10244]